MHYSMCSETAVTGVVDAGAYGAAKARLGAYAIEASAEGPIVQLYNCRYLPYGVCLRCK